MTSDSLKEYLLSRKVVLPPNKDLYLSSGPFSDRCLFCDDLHGGHPIMQRNFTETETLTPYRCCADCHWKIDKHDWTTMNSAEKTVKSIEDDLYFYATNGYLPNEDVFDRYIHIEPSHSENAGKCAFCSAEPYEEQKIINPVQGGELISGGELSLCGSHFDKLIAIADDIGGEFKEQAVFLRCYECNVKYPVLSDEAEKRRDTPHLCPICTYGQQVKFANRNFTPVFDRPRKFNYRRFYNLECSKCKQEEKLDGTKPFEFEVGEFICGSCYYNGQPPMFTHKFPINGAIFARVYYANREHTYLYRITDDATGKAISVEIVEKYPSLLLRIMSIEEAQWVIQQIPQHDHHLYSGSGPLFSDS